MSITAIIPTRDGTELLKQCVYNLMNGSVKPKKYIIVDDSVGEVSTDLKDLLRILPIGSVILKTEGSTGFSNSVNRGLVEATTDMILVINNDCCMGPLSLKSLIESLSIDPLAAGVTPLLSDRGKCSVLSNYVRRISLCSSLVTSEPKIAKREAFVRSNETEDQKRTHIPWTCLLLRKSAIDQVGLLDAERFPLGLYADDDWNMRATQLGWHFLLSTNSFAAHDNESSTFKKLNLDYNKELIAGRNNWLEKTKVLCCFLSCDAKKYSFAGYRSSLKLDLIRHTHMNYEGVLSPESLNVDSSVHWNMKCVNSLPSKRSHDQDQYYRLPRIIAARNMCLDFMRQEKSFTHLLFIDSDIEVERSDGLEKLLLAQTALIGGLVHGRGEHSHVEMKFGPIREYHGNQFTCLWGTCGYQLMSRVLCERYQFRQGRSKKVVHGLRSEDPAFAEDIAVDGWGEYIIDSEVKANHIDNEKSPLQISDVAEF
jgi:GT2 family glycosyltransferase